jgi:hypothetical protein
VLVGEALDCRIGTKKNSRDHGRINISRIMRERKKMPTK